MDEYVDHGAVYQPYSITQFGLTPYPITFVGATEYRLRTLRGGETGRAFVWEGRNGKVVANSWVGAGKEAMQVTLAAPPMTYEAARP